MQLPRVWGTEKKRSVDDEDDGTLETFLVWGLVPSKSSPGEANGPPSTGADVLRGVFPKLKEHQKEDHSAHHIPTVDLRVFTKTTSLLYFPVFESLWLA